MTAELRQGCAVLVATIVDDDLRARRQRLAERRARAKFWAVVEAKRAGQADEAWLERHIQRLRGTR